MADTPPSRRMSPLAIIILVVVALVAVVGFVQWRGTQRTQSGAAVAAKSKDAIMPVQATAPDAPQAASNQPWAKSHDGSASTSAAAGETANMAGAH